MNLGDFPYEVLFGILLNADPKDIANYCQTSKRASEICKDPVFWKRKYQRDFGQPDEIPSDNTRYRTWKEMYYFKSRKPHTMRLPMSASSSHYGIIDDQGNLYMAGKSSTR